MKRVSVFLGMVMSMVLGGAVCNAAILPPQGPGQIGLSSVVLCDSLSAHKDPGFDSPSVETLHYGDRIIVMDTENGWAKTALSDDVDGVPVWVKADFIAIDPSYYRTEGETAVYAWNDTGAKKVAVLDEGTVLPILRDDGDWIVVSLRGAAGWINNPVRSDSPSDDTSRNSSGDNGGSNAGSQGGVITVYDEFGESYTLYEGTDGYWRDRSGTAYDRLSRYMRETRGCLQMPRLRTIPLMRAMWNQGILHSTFMLQMDRPFSFIRPAGPCMRMPQAEPM